MEEEIFETSIEAKKIITINGSQVICLLHKPKKAILLNDFLIYQLKLKLRYFF